MKMMDSPRELHSPGVPPRKPKRAAVRTMVSLQEVQSPNVLRVIGMLVTSLFVIGSGVLAFTPWQQVASGKGRVIAYAPLDRQQTVEAPIEGRIVRWDVQEGSRVRRGDSLAEIRDNDPELMGRLRLEREALMSRLSAIQNRTTALGGRESALQVSLQGAVSAASARVRMAADRVRAAEEALKATEAALHTAELNLSRQEALAEKGLTAERSVELAKLDQVRALTDRDRARVSLTAARSEEAAMRAELTKAKADASAVVQDAQASQSSAEAEAANIRAEITRLDVRLARQEAQAITAPRDGVILRLLANQDGEMVKPGDPVAVLVPDTENRAVELWVKGNDVPLLTEGRAVRLQFEGWPALQFTGWPSVAVGTFGGKVAFLDATDNGAGEFRVVVLPDGEEPWPEPRYLRQGVRANGWVLLNQVPLGFELWRQFNGFPPALPQEGGHMEGPAKRIKK